MFESLKKFFDLLAGFTIGFIILVPASLLTKKNKIVFIGRDNGKFLDNVKYFFIYYHLTERIPGLDHYFITHDRNTYETLQKSELPVVFHPSLSSISILMRAKFIIADNYRWIYGLKYTLAYFAKKIQLWHGVGFKYTGRMRLKLHANFGIKRKAIEFFRILTEQIPNYDMFVTTSSFYAEEVFSKSFRIRKLLISGYPRNDILGKTAGSINKLELINTDTSVISELELKKADGYRIVLYTPTFRESADNSPNIDYEMLNKFGEQYKIIFVFKFHPDPSCKTTDTRSDNLLWYDNNKDIYPVIPLSDLLITDYSSIYMDYLLLDKPVIFYPYDLDSYLGDSGIQFDYDWITPGEKCFTSSDLIVAIEKTLIHGNDEFQDKRKSIRDFAFEHSDYRSSERVMKAIKDEYFRE